MAEIINLNRARKQRAAAAKKAVAEANRARFGRTRAQKQGDAAEIARINRAIDDARRED
ncbi:DUF4169 family protein [Sphingosinithalassobacter portus]|uniref:DUF4169 family protein n=1 Tax=Stakelama portus TaxID=2676234 RepID=UPI000D6E2B0F|nr:DUF4169 family protein [Sphingosinithalassobacter portus]